MKRGLYAITPDLSDTEELLRRVELVLQGGAVVLQYRNKLASPALALLQAKALRAMTHSYDVCFIINDSVDLMLQVDADGVHLGGDDGDLQLARKRIPQGKLLGASCYNDPDLATKAVAAGADYVAFGAVFASGTKPAARRASPDLLRIARGNITVPIVAIGGITPDNAGEVIAAGADNIAVIGSLFDAEHIKQTAQTFTQLFHVKR